jgi:Fe-S-cluster containining protein
VEHDPPEDGPLAAGEFGEWLHEVRAAIGGDGETDVACGSCVACCSSSQFVHIAPDERDSLAHIPKALLFPAPGAPRGHVLMGYDEHGRCPMLRADGCSIYEHRPRTCRTYDCRVFAAAGLLPDEPGKEAIAQRAARWRFDHADARSVALHAAVKAAAEYVRAHARELGDDAPHTTTQAAVVAVELAPLFEPASKPTTTAVRVALTRRRT